MIGRALDDTLQRRAVLQARSAALRLHLEVQLLGVQARVGWADRAADVAGWLWKHPAWIALPTLAMVAWRPKRLMVWVLRALTTARTVAAVRSAWRARR